MVFFDLILLLIVFGFVWYGFWIGFIHAIGGIISLILGAVFASRYYEALAVIIAPLVFGQNLNLARLVSFIIVFAVAQFVVSSVIGLINKIFHLPILKTINHLGGAIFGAIQGIVLVGLVLYFSTKFPLGTQWIGLLESSQIAPILMFAGKVLYPLIPAALKEIQSVIKI